jgi:hypothetical protein
MTEPFTILLIAGVFLLAFTITEPTERKPCPSLHTKSKPLRSAIAS